MQGHEYSRFRLSLENCVCRFAVSFASLAGGEGGGVVGAGDAGALRGGEVLFQVWHATSAQDAAQGADSDAVGICQGKGANPALWAFLGLLWWVLRGVLVGLGVLVVLVVHFCVGFRRRFSGRIL